MPILEATQGDILTMDPSPIANLRETSRLMGDLQTRVTLETRTGDDQALTPASVPLWTTRDNTTNILLTAQPLTHLTVPLTNPHTPNVTRLRHNRQTLTVSLRQRLRHYKTLLIVLA